MFVERFNSKQNHIYGARTAWKVRSKSEMFPSLPKIPRIDVTEIIFGGNFKHRYLPHYLIFLGKKLQTWSVKPTEHFGIYFGYIRRLFQGPFKFTETRPDSTRDVADARVTGVMTPHFLTPQEPTLTLFGPNFHFVYCKMYISMRERREEWGELGRWWTGTIELFLNALAHLLIFSQKVFFAPCAYAQY